MPAQTSQESRPVVSDLVERSSTAFTTLVRGFFTDFLGRSPVDGEEQGWVRQLLQGRTEEQVLSTFLSTPEFHVRARTLVPACPPDEAFVQALYQLLLERSATSTEASSWLGALPRLGREGIARFLLISSEYRQRQVEKLFRRHAHREGSPDEVAAWVGSPFGLGMIRRYFQGNY